MMRFLVVLMIGGICVQPVPVQAVEEEEEQAVREALRVLQDRFNVRDKTSLVGDVDFEYQYMPENGIRHAGVYSVARLAGLYTEPETTTPDTGEVASSQTPRTTVLDTEPGAAPVSALPDTGEVLSFPEERLPPARTLEEALQNLPASVRDTLVQHPLDKQRTLLERMGLLLPVQSSNGLAGGANEPAQEEAPDLLGADARELIGRNKRAAEKDFELILRRPPTNHMYREDITTAVKDYSMAERRLLRWDLDYLFEAIPPEVSLFLTPTAISIQGVQAEVTVDCEFRTMVDTPLSKPYAGKGGTLVLRLRKSGEGWRLEQLRAFVDQVRATTDIQG